MEEQVPKWADQQLSDKLMEYCEAGESARMEFKGEFPEQSHKLAKEFAALGTSGGGLVLIGVNDNCELVGVDASNGDARDELIERVYGILSRVRPDLNAEPLFAFREGKVVLAVQILEQCEPVFYYDQRPYIRHGTRSRPATPAEVKECVWSHPSSEAQRERERLKLEKEQSELEVSKSFAEARKRLLDR
jgi:predicted HTH transcriptional regulator